MNLTCLASSSAGNAYYIELERKDQEPVRLLVECGLKYQELNKKLVSYGLDLNKIDAVLITHGHNDHCVARNDLIKRGKKVFANQHLASSQETILSHGQSKYIAHNCLVTPFSVEHDVEDPLGFVIQTDVETILFATDLKYFKADLSMYKFDHIMIEANYDGQVIYFALENAKTSNNRGEIVRYERLVHSHMSISNCIKTLNKLNLTRCKAIILMHLSDRHANELLFKKRVKEETLTNCFVCKKNGGLI